MSSTVQSILADGVNAMFLDTILPSICNYLQQEKDVEVTVEELAACIGVNTAVKTPRMPPVSGISMGGTSAAASSRRTPKASSAKDSNKKTCTWKLVKGDHAGEDCGKTCAKDDGGDYLDYCRTHLKSAETRGNAKPKAGGSSAPKMPGPKMPGAVPQPNPSKQPQKKTAKYFLTPEGELMAYLHELANLVVVKGSTGSLNTVVGVCELTGENSEFTDPNNGQVKSYSVGTVRDLTEDETAYAKGLGFVVVGEVSASSYENEQPQEVKAPLSRANVPSIPRSAQAPPLPTIGSAPGVVTSQLPRPTLPQIPRPALPGVVQTPQLP